MIYTIDRVQIIDNSLVFFEFFGKRKGEDVNFINTKVHRLRSIASTSGISEIYGILYDHENFRCDRNSITIKKLIGNESNDFTWNEYMKKFKELNGGITTPSKSLGSATDKEGDPYVAEILKEIHGIDFSDDDNGLRITKEALEGTPTYGFDFDLFDDECKCIIEFLKRDNQFVTNLTSHPMRYLNNKQKFISLYKASRILNSSLYLVNYSNNDDESIAVIEVLNYNVTTGHFIEDCGYQFKDRDQLVEWLKLMNSNALNAKEFLRKLPKEHRTANFWSKYPENKKSIISEIGKNYKLDS